MLKYLAAALLATVLDNVFGPHRRWRREYRSRNLIRLWTM